MSKYEKIENILKIINIFDKNVYPVSIEYLADELGVNKKSVYRYIDTINRAGIPIGPVYNEEGRPTGKYEFFNDFSMKKLKITKEEITLLVVLHEFTKKMKNKFNDSFQTILNKVISDSGRDYYYIKIPDGPGIQKDNRFTEDIEKAIKTGSKIRMVYTKINGEKPYTYKICPLKIVFFDGFWYLVGITEKNKYMIKFRMDKIDSIELLDEKYDNCLNVKSLLENSVNVFFPIERNLKVKLKIDMEASPYFRQKIIFPEQKIIEDSENGLILETTVNQFIEIIHIICQWIPHVTILEPVELKDELKGTLEEYLNKFC